MKRTLLSNLTVLLLAAVTANAFTPQSGRDSYELTAKELRALMAKDTSVVLLDVRSPREYTEERIANTPLMPLQFLERRIAELAPYKRKKVVVYCHSGHRSEIALEILREYGFNALHLQGGLLQWKSNRFPTISGAVR